MNEHKIFLFCPMSLLAGRERVGDIVCGARGVAFFSFSAWHPIADYYKTRSTSKSHDTFSLVLASLISTCTYWTCDSIQMAKREPEGRNWA